MPSHDSSSSQRVSRILDAARASALSEATVPATDAELDEIWPDSWPPGSPAGQSGGQSAGESGGADEAGWAGRMSAGLGPGARWEVSVRLVVAAIGVLLVVVALAVLMLSRGPSPGTVVPAAEPIPLATGSVLPGAGSGSGYGTGTGTGAGSVVGSGPASTDAIGGSTALPAAAVVPSAGLYRVYVVGQVRRPGVVSLAPGARVEDAVDAAGGETVKADLAVMNLARKVIDGERIVVPRPGQKLPSTDPVPAAADVGGAGVGGTTGGQAGTVVPGTPVDLNTATVADLDALPGVGPVIAGRIVAWRQQNGNFKAVDDLGEVSGIGDATLEKLRPLVRV